jgi:hypothetical protein
MPLGKTMQGLAGDVFFSDLPLERDAVRSMSGHGFHPLKAQHPWSIPYAQVVHSQGRTPLAWDDWGGFYDHVAPPKVDQNGYGLRVPGLVVSPYAKSGFIDHQTLSFDAYAKFIEDDFLNGERLDPKTDGRPDPRPTVREDVPILGDLAADFDFTQPPRSPVVLKTTFVYAGAATVAKPPAARTAAKPPARAPAPRRN